MPFNIIRDDITRVKADAIVNTANPYPTIGPGTDSAIYAAAGAEALLAERKKIGVIPVGSAAATSAFGLQAKYIIHTVGPYWQDGKHGEIQALRSCYAQSLALAKSLNCESIAFPLIAAGSYRFPKDIAITAAASVIYDFLMENDMTVYLVVFDRRSFDISSEMFKDVRAYIDEAYVTDKKEKARASNSSVLIWEVERERRRRLMQAREHAAGAPVSVPVPPASLEEQLKKASGTFQEYLLELIIESGMKNSDVYHGANISKQHFSKIMSNKDYHPTKNTACALAIALHLDIAKTEALLEKAGLVLSDSSRFDLAVDYFIRNRMYNIVEDNIILDENDLELLGTQ